MDPRTPPSHIRYTAVIPNVREVMLVGTADPDLWHTILQPYRLRPYTPTGAAQLLINATALTWKGLSFRELIVTIAVCTNHNQTQPDGFYLVYALSTSRLLAWAERRMFKTPYEHGDIRVDLAAPQFEVRRNTQLLIRAQMARPAASSSMVDEAQSVPVFLPSRARQGRDFFFVSLSGEQTVYPFVPGADTVEITPAADHPALTWLTRSCFTATEWRIRANATHARSTTYRSNP